MGWPGIYSFCSPSWMVIKILSHWAGYFLPLSVSDSIKDIERAVYLELSPSLIGGIPLDLQDKLLYHELSFFLAGEIYLDLQDKMLLGIILFSLSKGFSLICWMWVFPIIHVVSLCGEWTGLSFWADTGDMGILLGLPLLWAWPVGL